MYMKNNLKSLNEMKNNFKVLKSTWKITLKSSNVHEKIILKCLNIHKKK